MKLTKISNDFTPLHQGLFYSIDTETEEPTDLVIEIVNSASGEVVATQQLRSITQAEVNIAPYIALPTNRTPSLQEGLTIEDVPTYAHHIRIRDMVSESITTCLNTEIIALPSLISAMPLTRRISHHERDELLLMVGAGKSIVVEIATDTNDSSTIYHTSATGCSLLSLSPRDFDTDSRTIEVTISCEEEELGTLHYNIVPSFKENIRLAWISACGSIERYTFPAVTSSKRKTERQILRTAEGWSAAGGTEYSISLASRYEPKATAAALAEIASSPKVWIEGDNALTEVAVIPSTVEQNIFNEPDCVNLDLLVWRREEAVC